MNDGTEDPYADLFAPAVQWRQETCRRGRPLVTIIDPRAGWAVYATPDDIAAAHRDGLDATGVARDLIDGGFIAAHPTTGELVDDSPPVGSGIVWAGADRFVRRWHDRGLHHLFHPYALAAQITCATLGAIAFTAAVFGRDVQLHADAIHIPAIIALGLIAVAVHELGHALVTVHYGRHVRRAGLRLHLGSPAFYVESLDAMLLTRRQRLMQAAAGVWFEWMFTCVAAITLLAIPADSSGAFLLHRFLIVNTIGIAINLLPFVGLDGALLLADIINEPDLTSRAAGAVIDRRDTVAIDPWLTGYSLANSSVGAVLLVSAGFFWWQLFGGLTITVWSTGAIGVVAVVTAVALLARQLIQTVCSTVPAIGNLATDLHAVVAFRFERRWRVQAIRAFRRELPGFAILDSSQLGILAGRLERTCVADANPGGGHHLYIPTRTGPWRRRDGVVVPAGAVQHHDDIDDIDDTTTAVRLPTAWRELLPT